jgi:ketosteroid isomerase-like protein
MRAVYCLAPLLVLAACREQAPDRPAAEKAVVAANAASDRALKDGDAAALERFYTADFRIIDDDANIHGKREQIEFMTKSVDLLTAATDDLRVTMLGPDAALLTGRFKGRYRMGGKEADFTERYTSVWVREGKDWRVKHEHASLVPSTTPAL